MSIMNKKKLPIVIITFPESKNIYTVDINTAREIRKNIDEQIQEHEQKNIINNLMNAVSSVFKGNKNE